MDDPNSNDLRVTKTTPSGRRPCLNCGQYHDSQVPCNGAAPRVVPPKEDKLIGKTIGGKYQIISHLGNGGMSRVYKANQLPINRIVALKMLLGHLTHEEESVQRFLLEAKAAGQVSHPNVVNIYDFGLAEDNQAYLVMDYLEGETLSQLLKRENAIPYNEAIPIFIQICEGLAAAHEQGVVHRDIKPSNILLQHVAEGRRVRVVDFGIAKMVDSDGAQHLTKTGEVFGSPLYMSPEQCEGATLDKRSDIYSLGLVLYEVLSGSVPLAGKTAIETMTMHIQSMPPSLQKAAADYQEIPLQLENIVFKMLERSRDKRYQTMLEVREDLKQFAAGQQEALSGNITYVRRELSRKSRFLAAAMIASAVLGLAGIIAFPYACSALAQQDYVKGNALLKEREYKAAEPLLRTAVERSRQGGDRAFESRSLASLAQVYRELHEDTLLNETRERRRELLKAELSRFDINKESLDSLILASKSSDTSEDSDSLIAMATPESSKAKSQATAASEESDLPTNQVRRYAATRQKENVKHESTAEVIDSLGEESTASDSFGSDFRTSREPAGRAALTSGGGGGGRGVRLLRSVSSGSMGLSAGDYGDGEGQLANDKKTAGSGAGFSATPLQTAALQSNALNVCENSKAGADAYGQLDQLQVIMDAYLDNHLYQKAKKCADKAIGLYEKLKLNSETDLSRLYTARAWSGLQLDEPGPALTDVRRSLDLAEKNKAKADEAEAEGIQSLIYLKMGNKEAAHVCYGKVCSILDSGVHKKPLLTEAMDSYKQQAK